MRVLAKFKRADNPLLWEYLESKKSIKVGELVVDEVIGVVQVDETIKDKAIIVDFGEPFGVWVASAFIGGPTLILDTTSQ